MSTSRTEQFFTTSAMKDFAKYPAAKFCAQLETELAAMTESRDKWQELAAKYAQEREHNANMALSYQSDLKAEREKAAKLRKFANHSTICTKAMAFWKPCDCGLEKALEETR